MSETTNINDLPANPASSGNLSLSVTESNNGSIDQGAQNVTLDQNTISQIVNGLQQASVSGATTLPSRDISQNTQSYTHDAHIQPNYLPPPPQNVKDYIGEEVDDDIVMRYNKQQNTSNSLDQLYDEMQIPLLIAVMFFLFQLPIFKKMLYQYFPVLFLKDGNINIYGYVFTSVLFGFLYYFIFKVMTHFSKF
jgi:hypothetical protein